MSLPPLPIGAPPQGTTPQYAYAVEVPVVIDTDVPCRKCSYNLRGLSTAGRCPECGTPVGVSYAGDLLRYSDPQWLETLRRGVNVILAAIVLMILSMVVAVGLVVVSVSAGRVAFAASRNLHLVMRLISIATGLMFLTGAWLLTAPDPSGLGEDQYGKARKLIRVTLLVGFGNNALGFVADMGGFYKEVLIVILIVGVLASLIGLVGQFAQLYYLEHLALRIPNATLSRRAHFLMYAIGITYGVLILFGAVAVIGRATGSMAVTTGGSCIAGLAALPLVVFGIMYIVMLEKFGRSFRDQAALARQVWAAQAAV